MYDYIGGVLNRHEHDLKTEVGNMVSNIIVETLNWEEGKIPECETIGDFRDMILDKYGLEKKGDN